MIPAPTICANCRTSHSIAVRCPTPEELAAGIMKASARLEDLGYEVIEFKVDPRIPVVELCGIRYQMELFHVMACGEPGAIFQIVDKGDGLRGVASVLGLAEMLGRVKELEGIVARKSALINRLVEEMHKRQGTA